MDKRVYGVLGISAIMANWNADFSGYPPPSPYNHPVSCFFHNITHWIHPPADEKDPSVSSQRSA